jgi:CTP:phosphocholine cytidylyltransferase-like protein
MVSGHSDDWVFDTGDDGLITRVGKGGDDCYNMVGISYFRREDAAILKEDIIKAYETPGNEQLFWDEVVDADLERLKLGIHPVEDGQIVEIDTCEELQAAEERMKR